MVEKVVCKDLPIRKSLMKTTTEFLATKIKKKKRKIKMDNITGVRAVLVPIKEGTEFNYTLQIKTEKMDWYEIPRIFYNPDTDNTFTNINDLRKDMQSGESKTKPDGE